VTACLRLWHFHLQYPAKDTTNFRNLTSLYGLQLHSAILHLTPPLLPPRARRSRQRIKSTSFTSQQWLRHLHQRRSARIHPHLLCMVLCTTTTNHTLPADRSAPPRKAILTDPPTLTAIPKRTCNAQPHRRRQAREPASLPRTSLHHLHRQRHLFDLQRITRHHARHQPVAHWPTCSATPTILLAAISLHHSPFYQRQARPQRSVTPPR